MPPPFPSSSDRSINPTDLSNILQGDDNNHLLDPSLNNTNPTTGFSEPSHMDSRNQGDHDIHGRFNPHSGLPPDQQPGNPLFTRQTAPLMGGQHENDNNDQNTNTFGQQQDPSGQAPTLGEKRQDEPNHDRIGLDPSQDCCSKNKEDAKSKTQPIQENQDEYKSCFKLRYPQPLTLNEPSVLVNGLEKMGFKYLLMTALVCLYLGQNGYGLLAFITTCGIGAAAFYSLSSDVLQSLMWQIEKIEGTNKLGKRSSDGETIEWFNGIAEKIWRSVDPRTFAVVEDILEDMLATVAPIVIKAAKVSDLDLGTAAPRIEKIQVFPPGPDQLPDTIFGIVEFSLRASSSSSSVGNRKGPYVTPPGVSIRFKSSINASVDVRGELTKLVGKVRFKILTAPVPPFVSKVTFSFTEAPSIETSVMPVTKKLNIMRLPMLQTLVDEGVKLGFSQLIEPESMTIDVAQIMAAQSDTAAIGLVQLQVRQLQAINPNPRDPEDLFVTLSSNNDLKKDIKSTRVLTNKLNPTWNENLYQLVTLDDISKDAQLNIKVVQASKLQSDETLGSILVSVKDIVHGVLDENNNVTDWCADERVMFDGWRPVNGNSDEDTGMRLDAKLSFHPKYVVPNISHTKTEAAKKQKAEKEARQRNNVKDNSIEIEQLKEIVQKLKEDAVAVGGSSSKSTVSQDPRHNDIAIVSGNDSDLGRTELVAIGTSNSPKTSPPIADVSEDPSEDSDFEPGERVSPHHISGILSINISEAEGLEIMAPEMISSKKQRHPYNSDKPVNPYAIVYLNDHKIYQTRSKMRTATPFWNADTECFVKNYGTSFIRISVKNNIDLEEDPVIGTVVFKISELFEGGLKKVKEAKKWVTLGNGIGYGKVLLALTYKPIKLILPRELLGSDVGTLVIQSIKLVDVKIPLDSSKSTGTKATLALNVEPRIEKYLQPDSMAELNNGVCGWIDQNMYFPLLMRYRTAIFVHLSQGTINKNKVTARLWMKEILDYEWQEVTLALHEFVSENSSQGNGDENPWGSVGPCGSIVVRLKFVPGFSPAHTLLPSFTTDMLGVDPFHKDDLWEKAHLLVQHESSENYASQDLASPAIDKDKRQKVMDYMNKSPQRDSLISMTKQTAKHRKSVVPSMQEKQKQEIGTLLQSKEESNDISSMKVKDQQNASTGAPVGRFDIFNEHSYDPLIEEFASMKPAAISNTTERRDMRARRFDTSKEPSYSSTSNRRSSFVESLDEISDKKLSKASVPCNPPVNNPSSLNSKATTAQLDAAPPPSSLSNSGNTTVNNVPFTGADKLNEIQEVEAVAYLDTMKDDLKNSKINDRKVSRVFAKGKSFFTQPLNAMKQGHNSEERANMSIKKET